MDFSLSAEQVDAAKLAADILAATCTADCFREVADSPNGRFSESVWRALSEAGLLSLSLPESVGGSDLGFAEACSVILEVGKKVAPVPLATHVVTAMALARFGDRTQHQDLLEAASEGTKILSCAIPEDLDEAPIAPAMRATLEAGHWVLSGTKTNVVAGAIADWLIIPATTSEGVGLFLIETSAIQQVEVQRISDGDRVARLTLDDFHVSEDSLLGTADGLAHTWLLEHLTVAVCAQQLGTVEGALDLTAEYAKTREQFGRPIGTFQAVSQRLADGYIDILGARLTLWQAVWRLSAGLEAGEAVAIAKLWAADAGHKLAHTTVHVHGGVGIDLDGEAHRYFTAAKMNEFLMGGATEQARRIGASLAG
jgi:alkylation response protein AidB-like acyl-CoA dehydrogenase